MYDGATGALVSAGRDGQVIVWDVTTGSVAQAVQGHGAEGVTNSQNVSVSVGEMVDRWLPSPPPQPRRDLPKR